VDPNAVSCRDLPGFHLRLLGRFELCHDGRPLHVSPAGERLLAYLGIRPEPVGRGAAAAELWPGCTDIRAAANLRSAVWRLTGTREWFRQIRLHALEALCDRYRDDGRLDAALDAGITAVAADPLRESAHRQLALVHIEEGNFAEALRQYEVFRRLLRTELGLAPSSRFRKLVAPLLGRPLDGTAS
jgi:DNA-binding SARP family transcriptional activator